MSLKTKKTVVPIYQASVTFIKGKMEDIYKKFKMEPPIEYDAFVMWDRDKDGAFIYWVCLDVDLKPSVIAHEVVHLVNKIFEHRHVKLDTKNDEPQAYLTGYLFDQIHKFYYT